MHKRSLDNSQVTSDSRGWALFPEGAAVHHGERLAVVADLHLGYEWARGGAGDLLLAHSLEETQAKLTTLLERARFHRLVVAGDLVESARWCQRTHEDVARLVGWLAERGVTLVALRGNHDPPRRPPLPAMIDVAGWTICHGDQPVHGPRVMFGHHHPVLKVSGTMAPCFLVGPTTIVLPAFSHNAAGLDVGSTAFARALGREPLRCWASTGEELLDFGLIG
jgi:metallophosphoesterase superfamily enzyme